MKKTYEKPKVVIQDMSVNCFVAGDCSNAGAAVLDYAEDSCTYFDEESYITFFSYQCADTSGLAIDIVHPNPASPFAQICYHRPLDVLSFFNS